MKFAAITITLLYFALFGWVFSSWSQLVDTLSTSNGSGDPKLVVIPPSTDLKGALKILQSENLLQPSEAIERYADGFHITKKVIPGEYRLSPTMTPVKLIEELERGEVVTHTVSITPGSTAAEVIEGLVEQRLGDAVQLRSLVNDPVFARTLKIPGGSLEGFLYPDVYALPRGMDAKALLSRLVERHRSTVSEELTKDASLRGLSPYELVVMASLIETKKLKSKELRMYSALLHNRLKRKWALNHKAADAYGAQRVDPQASKYDQRKNPWNTTYRKGLPQTPIANPSKDSLVAAARPANSRALYLVPRGDGTHVFCEDLECYQTFWNQWVQKGYPPVPRRFR